MMVGFSMTDKVIKGSVYVCDVEMPGFCIKPKESAMIIVNELYNPFFLENTNAFAQRKIAH